MNDEFERLLQTLLAARVKFVEGLIRAKRAAGRPKDLRALHELEALLALKQRGEEE